MLEALLLMSAALLCWAAFGWLALAQERHFRLFYMYFRPVDHAIYAQAAIALIAIVLALSFCVQAEGAGFGSVLWVLLIIASAITVALQLTWAPGCLTPLAWLFKHFFHHDSFIHKTE